MNRKVEKLIEEVKESILKIDTKIDECKEMIKHESKKYLYEDNCNSDTDLIDYNIDILEKELHKLEKLKEFNEDYLTEKAKKCKI